jgi:hypothetical protein
VGLMLLAFYHFGGKTMTKAEAVSLLMQAVGWFGGLSVVSIGVAAFVSKLIADRSIESHKAQLGQETERLKGELAKETESHKFSHQGFETVFWFKQGGPPIERDNGSDFSRAVPSVKDTSRRFHRSPHCFGRLYQLCLSRRAR